jgi:hypothetical protein
MEWEERVGGRGTCSVQRGSGSPGCMNAIRPSRMTKAIWSPADEVGVRRFRGRENREGRSDIGPSQRVTREEDAARAGKTALLDRDGDRNRRVRCD